MAESLPRVSGQGLPLSLVNRSPLPVNVRVLVMNESEVCFNYLRHTFSSEVLGVNHIELVASHNPVTFISLVEEEQFDILLVDFHTPRLDGLKLLEWLAKNKHANQGALKIFFTDDPDIPTIVRSAIVQQGAKIMFKHGHQERVQTWVRHSLKTEQRQKSLQ